MLVLVPAKLHSRGTYLLSTGCRNVEGYGLVRGVREGQRPLWMSFGGHASCRRMLRSFRGMRRYELEKMLVQPFHFGLRKRSKQQQYPITQSGQGKYTEIKPPFRFEWKTMGVSSEMRNKSRPRHPLEGNHGRYQHN